MCLLICDEATSSTTNDRPGIFSPPAFGNVVFWCSDQAAFCSAVAGGFLDKVRFHGSSTMMAFAHGWIIGLQIFM